MEKKVGWTCLFVCKKYNRMIKERGIPCDRTKRCKDEDATPS
jgi:hypothetical protein